MHQRVAVEEQRLPLFTTRWRHSHGEDAIQKLQHHPFVLLEQFVGKFRQNLQEGQIRRRASGIVGVLQRIGGEEDSVSVKGSDSFAIFQSVQTEGKGKSFR